MSAPLLIADSGPLIALARLDLLDLPRRYFDTVFVVDAVWNEVTRRPKAGEAERLVAALESGVLQRLDDPVSSPDSLLRAGLDVGERNSIARGIEMQAGLLIDERRGRKAARALGLPVLGTFGLLVLAYENGVISSLRAQVDQLQASGYFLPEELVKQTLAALGE